MNPEQTDGEIEPGYHGRRFPDLSGRVHRDYGGPRILNRPMERSNRGHYGPRFPDLSGRVHRDYGGAMNPEQTDGEIEPGSSRTKGPGCVAKNDPGSSRVMNSGPVDGKKEQRLSQETDPGPIIEVKGLSFRHPPTASGRSVTALQDVSLTIRPGEVVGLAGMSGSGKSTFCYCLNGLIPHLIPGTMAGTVTVLGENTNSCRVTDLAAHVALVFQNPEDQIFSSDVESEIAFGPEQMGWPGEEIGKTIDASLEALGITHLRDRDPGDLSWGERQRVAIAAAIAVHPEVLVLDEPFSGIDHETSLRLTGLIAALTRTRGTTVIIAEQRLSWLLPVVQRLVVFDHGRVVHDGPIGTLPAWYTGEDRFYSHRMHPTGSSGPGAGERSPAVSVRELEFYYPGREEPAISVQRLDIFPGEITVIRGQNGSGKSTFIRHLNGIQKPASGGLQLMGKEVRGRSTADLSREAGVLLQHADYQTLRRDRLRGTCVRPGEPRGRRGGDRQAGQECRRPAGHHRARVNVASSRPLRRGETAGGNRQHARHGDSRGGAGRTDPRARPAVQADCRGGARRAPGFRGGGHRGHP